MVHVQKKIQFKRGSGSVGRAVVIGKFSFYQNTKKGKKRLEMSLLKRISFKPFIVLLNRIFFIFVRINLCSRKKLRMRLMSEVTTLPTVP